MFSIVRRIGKVLINYQVLNAVCFLGHAFGYHIGQENKQYLGYNCSEMLTRNELNTVASRVLCAWLEKRGYVIEDIHIKREPCLCIIANNQGNKMYITFASEIDPNSPGFIKADLDALYLMAKQNNAIPYYACVCLRSSDESHCTDGIILADDGIEYIVSSFELLESE